MPKKTKAREIKLFLTKGSYTAREVYNLVTNSIKEARKKKANVIVPVTLGPRLFPRKI